MVDSISKSIYGSDLDYGGPKKDPWLKWFTGGLIAAGIAALMASCAPEPSHAQVYGQSICMEESDVLGALAEKEGINLFDRFEYAGPDDHLFGETALIFQKPNAPYLVIYFDADGCHYSNDFFDQDKLDAFVEKHKEYLENDKEPRA